MAFTESSMAASMPEAPKRPSRKRKPEPFEESDAAEEVAPEDLGMVREDEIKEVAPEAIGMKELPRARRRQLVNKEGRPIVSTPESRARFEQERAAERADLEQLRREIEGRLEAMEHRIVENRGAADRAKAERANIETAHALRMGEIASEAAERRRADKAAHEFVYEPARAIVRERGREKGVAEQKRAEGRFAEEMEFDEDGRIIGLKNMPEVTAGAAFRANAPAMRKIIEDRAWTERTLKGGWKRRRLKQLDMDAEKWRDLFDNANEQLSYGLPAEEVYVENPFYRQVEDVNIEGMDQQEVETLLVSPEQALDKKYDLLKAESEAVDKALASAEKMEADVWAFVGGERVKLDLNTEAVEFYEQYTDRLKAKLVRLNAEHDLNHRMQEPDNLDIRGARLKADIDRALGMVETKRKELKAFSGDKGVKTGILVEIKEYEHEASEAQSELAAWEANPIREEAMKARREDLQEAASRLLDRILETEKEIGDNERAVARLEGAAGRALEAFDARLLRESLDLIEDAQAYLLREKALVEDKRTNVLRARMQLEAEKLGVEEELEAPPQEEAQEAA